MKKQLLLVIAAVFMLCQAQAQTDKLWSLHKGESGKIVTAKGVARATFPKKFDLYDLNMNLLREALFSTREMTGRQSVVITLPNVKGELEQFEMFEASNFDAELQALYPEIRAYSGQGITDKYATLKLSISPQGIQTMIFRADKENEFMEPYSVDAKTYAVFNSSRQKGQLAWTCSTDDQKLVSDISSQLPSTQRSSVGQLKTMRLAQSCTGEYAAYFGATTFGSAADKALVMAAFNATMSRCNGVYEKDLGLHLNIIAGSNNLIFCNAATDPYSAAATGATGAWNTELQNTLSNTTNAYLGATLAACNAAYDIGHLFGASGGGGNAGCIGCVCVDDTNSATDKKKGSGFTSPGDNVPQGDNFDIDFVVHEVGHQLGGNHTFSMANEASGVNMEVGSGVTIMGYAGITNQDVAAHSIDVYHAASIAQIQANLATKTCPVTTNITANNATPVANAGADYTIPKSTPFALTGSATDNTPGSLTYSWEQYDDDTAAQIDAASAAIITKTVGPNWRSFSPSTSPIRNFPQLSSILANSQTTFGAAIDVEALSSVARTLNFRLTVRDNSAYSASAPIKVGQTNFDDTVITVSGTVGPFDVTSQSANGITWVPGTSETVTWTVNNTTTLPGSTNVDILLSTDGGLTFPTVLLANTPNDGSQVITVPSVSAPYCRIKVKPTGHIYFDINSKSFAIGNYVYQTQNVCTDYPFNINAAITESTGGTYPGMSLTIADSFTITDANFYANVTHPNIGQFNLLIMAPWQASLNTAIWYNNTTCTGANLNKWFDTPGTAVSCANTTASAFASAFTPYSSANIAAYPGNNSAGAWKIYFKDTVVDANVAAALFNTFTIQLCQSQVVPVLATETFGLENFSIYPNPNNGNFNVQFTSSSSNQIKVGVHDMRGRLVFENNYQNTGAFNQNLQLKNVQSGIYIVTVQDGERKEVSKIVVE
ncbi:reprolysin-like metallopeptidase [Flavobacterium sp.]|uniref:zinc-dependent metalloprotease n=1 Tax=Flavobacterium sp. TaxID=239 RepID=UPI0026140B38|nr:zinc-dependent metalloprotease family protein [Flavobacterium sp.]